MKTTLKQLTLAALALASVILTSNSTAQVLISSGNYSQDFNTLPTSDGGWTDNSTLAGWYAGTNGGGGGTATLIRASTGSSTTASLYSFGASADADRALGSLSGSTPGTIAYGVRFTNDTANVVTNITVTYTGEEWRRVSGAPTNTLTFSYSVGANFATADPGNATYTWTSLYLLDFSSPNTVGSTGAQVGNAATNRQTLTSLLLPNVQVGPGQELFLRWSDVDDSGSDYGLGIDDLSVTFTAASPAAPYITSQPKGRTNALGSTATFSVGVAGTAPFTYQWKKNGSDLANGVDNVSGANTATLSITNVSPSHNGTYTCGITNVVGGTNTAGAAFAVIDPGIISQPTSSSNLLGERQVFSVVAGGTGPFGYQWRRNGTNYGDPTTNSFIVITNVSAADATSYSVVLTNSLGGSVTSSVATLSLLTTPTTEIAQWDFNGTPDGSNLTGTLTPTIGGGTASLIGPPSQTFSSGASQDPILATVDNSGWSTSDYPTSTTSNKTTGVQFQFSTAGYQDILVTWHQRHSGTASRYARMQYSTDGTTFTDFHLVTRTNTDFDREIVNLSAITAANNNASFAIRIVSEFESTATGLGSASYVGSAGGNYSASVGTIRFDWLNVFANTNTTVPPIPLNIQLIGANAVLTWTNAAFNLQAAPVVTGTYTNIPGATSPHTNPVAGNPKFFRLKNP